MDEVLDQLNRLRGVGGSLLLSPDGLPMASRLRSDVDEDAISAAIADLVARAHQFTERLDLGRARMLHCRCGEGGVMLLAAGPGYLAVLVDVGANLALLQLEVRPFLEAISRRLAI